MIWVDGQILPDDGLSISVLDRTFEHGLGLFETLRTWGGRPTLLDRHKARMLRSAGELKVPIDSASLPDAEAVRELLDAERAGGDRLLRITASGGTASGKSVVWMRSSPLPPTMGECGAKVDAGPWSIAEGGGPLAHHKTLNYWEKLRAFDEGRHRGHDEILSMAPGGLCWEGSRTNLFAIHGDVLSTCWQRGPILPGVMREFVLELAGELPLEVRERHGLPLEELHRADELFLTNAVRGIIPVASLEGNHQHPRWTTPGPWTHRLQVLVSERLGGGNP
jgi:branched-chain amino acid aminotransferase